jgi:hypothetical protein
MGLYKVILADHGIVPGVLSKDGNGHYSTAQYNQAYNNGVGIQSAIDFAAANGYSGIVLPKNTYSLVYHTADSYNNGIIYARSNQEINLGGSKLEVIYDSTESSPYNTYLVDPFRVVGVVIMTLNVYNVKICNGEIKGDIYQRSFIDGGEAYIEQTYGIFANTNSYNIEILDLDIHGFMGDGITGSTRSFAGDISFIVEPVGDMVTGYYETNGSISVRPDAFYSQNIIPIDRAALKSKSPLYPNVIQLQTAGGYTRVPLFKNTVVEVLFFNSSGTFISKIPVVYLDKIVLPYNATGVRLQLTKQTPAATMTHPYFAFTQPASSKLDITRCLIHDNHRGGLSNLPDDTKVFKNDIYHNGMDSSINAPYFPDSTRYAINCEDAVSRNLIIEDNNIYSGYNCLLMGCYNFEVINNTITNFSGISAIHIYDVFNAVVKNNRIYNSNFISFTEVGQFVRNCFASENTVVYGLSSITMGLTNTVNLKLTNNKFEALSYYILNFGDSKIAENEFKFISTSFVSNFFDVNNFSDNKLLFPSDVVQVLYYDNRGGKNNFFKNAKIERSGDMGLTFNFDNDTLENCSIVPSCNLPGNRSLNFKNCSLTGCYIEPFRKTDTSPSVSVLSFDNCDINISNNRLIYLNYGNLQNLSIKIDFTNSKLNYSNPNTKLIDKIAMPTGVAKLAISDTQVNGNPNFETNIF